VWSRKSLRAVVWLWSVSNGGHKKSSDLRGKEGMSVEVFPKKCAIFFLHPKFQTAKNRKTHWTSETEQILSEFVTKVSNFEIRGDLIGHDFSCRGCVR
jgi:hypothetical protein